MKKIGNRILSLFLAAVMLFTLVPYTAFAAETGSGQGTATLTDGVYTLPVDLINASSGSASMGNGALRGSSSNSDKSYLTRLIVNNGKGTLLIQFVPLYALNTTGFLYKFTSAASGISNPVILSEYRYTNGDIYYDSYNDSVTGTFSSAKGKPYPKLLAVDIGTVPANAVTPTKLSDMLLMAVEVPPMGSSANQNVRLKIGYSDAKQVDDLTADAEYWYYEATLVKKTSAVTTDTWNALQAKINELKTRLSNETVSITFDNGIVHNKQSLTTDEQKAYSMELRTLMAQVDCEKNGTDLAAYKANKIEELKGYVNKESYRSAEQEEVSSAIASGTTVINNAADITAVIKALDEAKTAINKIKTDAQLTAEELAEAKTGAINVLKAYKNASDYRSAQKTTLSNAIKTGETAINAAADKTAVAAALENAKAVIDQIKTDAQLTAEELVEAKEKAVSDLGNYADPANYREEQQGELTKAIEDGTKDINAAADKAAVDSALATAKQVIDGIATDEALTAANLQAAKNEALSKLDAYNASDYRATEREALKEAVENGKTAIHNAADTKEVENALAGAEKEISAIKTDAQLTAEEEQAAKELAEAKDALQKVIGEAEAIGQGNKTDTAFKALTEAVKSARQVYENGSTADIAAQTELLKKAIEEFQNSSDSTGLDQSGLQEGTYSVNVTMINASNPAQNSMSDKAVVKPVLLTVKNGEYSITCNFQGISIGAFYGYLRELYYWDGTTDREGNDNYKAVTVDSYYDDLKDDFNVDESGKILFKYPHQMTFPLINKSQGDENGYVKLRVFVPIMEAIAAGTGTQNVYMSIDWTSLIPGSEAAENAAKAEAARIVLKSSVKSGKEISNSDGKYTADSYKALQDAITAAEALIANTSATAEQLNTAGTAIRTARRNLALAPQKSTGQEASTQKPAASASASQAPATTPTKAATQNSNATNTVTEKKVKGVTYKVVNAKTAQVIKADNSIKTATIPATVKIGKGSYKVTSIKAKAFQNKKKLKSVTIGANITEIGKAAFQKDKNLKKIVFKGKNVKKIGKTAFSGINSKAVFKMPKAKLAKYKKLMKGAGAPKKAKYTK